MNQKEFARNMGMDPRSLRTVIASLRKKGYPVLAQKGMSLCYDPGLVRNEAMTLLGHANREIGAAGSLIQILNNNIIDEDLTPVERFVLNSLPVIENQFTPFDSEVEFPFMNLR